MSERTIKVKQCDICKKEIEIPYNNVSDVYKEIENVKIPVLLKTEQTEGRPTTPYITQAGIDMCKDCLNKAVTIEAIVSQYNHQYWFMEDK